MKRVLFFNVISGLASYILDTPVDDLYKEDEIYNGYAVRYIDQNEIADTVLKTYYLKNGIVKNHLGSPSEYHIWNLETEQWQEPENYQQLLFDEAAGKVKQERQRLLATTDWTDTVSASTRLENYDAWQLYRQQLRDITTQEGYPFNVIWPAQPV